MLVIDMEKLVSNTLYSSRPQQGKATSNSSYFFTNGAIARFLFLFAFVKQQTSKLNNNILCYRPARFL